MQRLGTGIVAVVFAIGMGIGCSEGAKDDDDGGTRQPAAPRPDDADLPCAQAGEPCRADEADPTAAERSEAYLDEIGRRVIDGADLESLGEWIGTQPGVVDFAARDGALWFKVEGDLVRWFIDSRKRNVEPYDPSRRGLRVADVARRPNAAQDEFNGERKRALFLDPFRWQMESDQEALIRTLERRREFGLNAVERFASTEKGVDPVPIERFLGWNDYDFVMVTTHGDALQSKVDGKVHEEFVLYTSLDCETLGPYGKHPGVACMRMAVPERRAGGDQTIVQHTLGMNANFFKKAYARPIEKSVLFVDACHSAGLASTIVGGANATSVYFGWNDVIYIDNSIRAAAALVDALVTNGLKAGDAYDDLFDKQLTMFAQQRAKGTAYTASLESEGETRLRAVEVVHFLDPVTQQIITPTSVPTIPLVERPGGTTLEIPIAIEGIKGDSPQTYRLSIEYEGNVVAGPTNIVADPADSDLHIIPAFRIELPAFTMDTQIRLRAKVELPEEGESTHTADLFVLSPGPTAWRAVLGGTQFVGDFISAMPRAVMTPEGLVWTYTLNQAQDDLEPPSGSFAIRNHPGRETDCTGMTGMFPGDLSIIGDDDFLYGGEDLLVEIQQLDIDRFRARATGMGQRLDTTDPNAMPFPVNIDLTIDWANAGCTPGPGPDPGTEGHIGSYTSTDVSFVCFDAFAESVYMTREILMMTLAGAPELMYRADLCDSMDRIGYCDYRNMSAGPMFRGTRQNFYIGFETPPADLATACSLQGGTWVMD